ncbi:hypothetical protein M5D96_010950 [Drosophila gunungcola]|uniref:Vesicle-associated membrane protein 7 n=1 Tax=Drosophila gunungcola TaxID=103775 RepID=A0A9P9YG76_9MUSC|nr:hypothetical protein M5D96_010950 [Drosophila gunungcola]
MPILYSVISRGTTVLAKFAECVGNFAEVTEHIIGRIGVHNHKMTYTHGDYLIHYNCENKLVYMCITDNEFEQSRAFLFLADVKQKFIQTYGLQVATAIAYSMNTEFSKILAQQMVYFSQSREVDTISRVHGQIDELKDIMVKNIDSLRDRGEKLELLVNKTENLSNNVRCHQVSWEMLPYLLFLQSVAFRKASRNLARQMFWKNIRIYVVVGLVITFIVYVIRLEWLSVRVYRSRLHIYVRNDAASAWAHRSEHSIIPNAKPLPIVLGIGLIHIHFQIETSTELQGVHRILQAGVKISHRRKVHQHKTGGIGEGAL